MERENLGTIKRCKHFGGIFCNSHDIGIPRCDESAQPKQVVTWYMVMFSSYTTNTGCDIICLLSLKFRCSC